MARLNYLIPAYLYGAGSRLRVSTGCCCPPLEGVVATLREVVAEVASFVDVREAASSPTSESTDVVGVLTSFASC
jgi:hypothetical protein